MRTTLLSLLLLATACSSQVDELAESTAIAGTTNSSTTSNLQDSTDMSTTKYYSESSTVADVIADTAFGDFGHLLFPVDRNVSTSSVYVWYNYIRPETTVNIINRLHDDAVAGNQIFYRFYTDAEIAADSEKAFTGLFLFRGNAGAPFAICNAGGGFAYVGAMHDSMPHALWLSEQGMNAFAIIYRPDTPYADLARAIAYIHDNAAALGVRADDYSLWGGSAGARMAATLGNEAYLQQLTGRTDIPQAAAVIMQYTGYSYVSQYDAPTYACVGTSDGIASYRTMQNRLAALSALGIATEFHAYDGLPHGFGVGTGTVAEGWTADALQFWKSNMKGSSGVEPVYYR